MGKPEYCGGQDYQDDPDFGDAESSQEIPQEILPAAEPGDHHHWYAYGHQARRYLLPHGGVGVGQERFRFRAQREAVRSGDDVSYGALYRRDYYDESQIGAEHEGKPEERRPFHFAYEIRAIPFCDYRPRLIGQHDP